jgi:dTDP-4-amino-4,6-dideoxygalactose transaminase
MRSDFLVFGRPKIEDAEIDEVVASMKSGWLGTGPKVKAFEQSFALYKSSPWALAVNSCTAALHLSMLAAGLRQGDEVLVPSLTFAATANAVIHAGGVPVLVDCDPQTMNICLQDAERKINARTKAIIPVHFAGRPCRMDALMECAQSYRLKVIEDCAHAIEGEYRGQGLGTFGDFGCFSFYVTKNIVTGEGGMVLTRREEDADQIKILALHGMTKDAWSRFSDAGYKHYQVVYAGFKYNMMDIQAAIGIHQLKRIDQYWQRRADIWAQYCQAFAGLPLRLPAEPDPDTKHSYHLFTLLLDLERLSITRDEFIEQMTARQIGVGVHYIGLHLHPFYKKTFGYREGDMPATEWISERTVSLPLSAQLSETDVQDVIEAVTDILTVNERSHRKHPTVSLSGSLSSSKVCSSSTVHEG